MGFVIVGLYPFRWNPPTSLRNGAIQSNHGTLEFAEAGIAYGRQASEWIDRAMQSDSFELQLRVRSWRGEQDGPARILTISRSPVLRNLTIGQSATDLVVRLRTPATSFNGIPDHTIKSVFVDSRPHDILVTVQPGELVVSVDQQVRLRRPLPARSLANWDRRYELAFGNELTHNRPWIGEISQAKVKVGMWEQDYTQSDSLRIPGVLWQGIKLQLYTPGKSLVLDVLLNFFCFVPFGFCLAMGWGRCWPAALACAAISLSVEFLQLFFDSRMPSVSDWTSNSLGAVVGALAAYLAYDHFRSISKLPHPLPIAQAVSVRE